MVNRSVSAWQGWSSSERPLTTGHWAMRANSSISDWENVRITTTSEYEVNTRATSGRDSRPFRPASCVVRNTLPPPSWMAAASKLFRVRSEGFSNTSVSTRPCNSGGRSPPASRSLSSAEILRISSTSWGVMSKNVVKCRLPWSGSLAALRGRAAAACGRAELPAEERAAAAARGRAAAGAFGPGGALGFERPGVAPSGRADAAMRGCVPPEDSNPRARDGRSVFIGHLPQRFGQRLAARVNLFGRDVERRQEPHHRVVCRVDEHAATHAFFHRGAGRDRQVDTDHQPLDPQLGNNGQFVLERFKMLAEPLGHSATILEQALVFDHVDSCRAGRHRQRIAAERAGVGAGPQAFGNFLAGDH